MSDMQIGLNRQLKNIAAAILEHGTLEYKVITKHIGRKPGNHERKGKNEHRQMGYSSHGFWLQHYRILRKRHHERLQGCVQCHQG